MRARCFRTPSVSRCLSVPSRARYFLCFSSPMSLCHEMSSESREQTSHKYFQYEPIEDVERLEGYRLGGYHPVMIGDRLNDQYRVVHKLGFGTYSTTWLARKEEKDKTGKYVAIKVATASSDFQDSSILHQLGDKGGLKSEHPGSRMIAPILDEFAIEGPNGEHQCLVTAPARVSLSDAKEASFIRLFQLPVARAIAAQLTQAVAFLHMQGIVHADLHPGNILLRLHEPIDELSPDEFYEKYRQPYTEPIIRFDNQSLPDGVPSHGVVPVWLGNRSERISLAEAGIFITDFGESFDPTVTWRRHSNTPNLLIPPEVFFTQDRLSFPADIWTLAGCIWSIIGQRPLFEGFDSSADAVIKEQVDTLGKLHPLWWERWKARSNWFGEEGSRLDGLGRPWAERFEYSVQEPRQDCVMSRLGKDEEKALSDMLMSMMAFRPSERPTADDVLKSDWMTKWALPELDVLRESH